MVRLSDASTDGRRGTSILPSERIFGTRQRRRSIAVYLVFVIAVTSVWFGFSRAQTERRVDAVRSWIEQDSSAEMRSLERWMDGQLTDARYWASNPAVIDATTRLLDTDPAELLDSAPQAELRQLLGDFLEVNRLAGYFVVRPDGLSIASSRDVNIGDQNLVATDHPSVFADVIAGTPTVTPPQMSDVALFADDELTETMFVAAPIVVDGDVVAAFMLRIIPSLTVPPPADGFGDDVADHAVFSSSGVAVTGFGSIAPLDPVTIDGRPASQLFEPAVGGTNIPPGTTTYVDRVEAWAVSPELGLGVVGVYDGDRLFANGRAQRRASMAVAVMIAAIGSALALFAHLLVSRERARQLDTSHRRFRSLVDPSPDPTLRVRPDGTVLAANEALRRMMESVESRAGDLAALADGVSEARDAVTIADLATRHPILAELTIHWADAVSAIDPWTVERVNAIDGGLHDRYYRVRFVPVAPGSDDHEILVLITDVTREVEREMRLESLVLVDALTGLSNRTAINDRLSHALDLLHRPAPGAGVAVIVIDLDHFKPINDAFGHSTGDEVLAAVGLALSKTLREQDSVGRLGGDEFLVVCEEVPDLETAEMVTERLTEAINSLVVDTDASTLHVSASFGVAWTATPTAPTELFARADRAMFSAKQRRGGTGFAVSHSTTSDSNVHDIERERSLFGALARNEFEMHYQPVVDADGRTTGAEALLRWNHPKLGMLTPGSFLSSLMESGSIGAVGRWGVAEALAQAARWRDSGSPIDINVNISPAELSAGTIDVVETELDRLGLDPATVCVEITEHAFSGGILTSGAIARLGDMGVQIALDDFGTGASTLSQLRERPLHWLKLDRTFVESIDAATARARMDMPILRAIIGLADDLHLGVVAEGVETVRQLDWLASAGCTRFQGWAFGQAVPASEFDPTARLAAVEHTDTGVTPTV